MSSNENPEKDLTKRMNQWNKQLEKVLRLPLYCIIQKTMDDVLQIVDELPKLKKDIEAGLFGAEALARDKVYFDALLQNLCACAQRMYKAMCEPYILNSIRSFETATTAHILADEDLYGEGRKKISKELRFYEVRPSKPSRDEKLMMIQNELDNSVRSIKCRIPEMSASTTRWMAFHMEECMNRHRIAADTHMAIGKKHESVEAMVSTTEDIIAKLRNFIPIELEEEVSHDPVSIQNES